MNVVPIKIALLTKIVASFCTNVFYVKYESSFTVIELLEISILAYETAKKNE